MNQKNLVVLARIKAKSGMEQHALKELTKLIEPTIKEEGCIKYELNTSLKDPCEFLFYEIWTSQDALTKHSESTHIKAFRTIREEFLDGGPEVTLWEQSHSCSPKL